MSSSRSFTTSVPGEGVETVAEPTRVLRGNSAAAVALAPIAGDLRGGRTPSTFDSAALETARRAAAAQGYAEGWAEGQRAAQAQVRAEAAREAALFAEQQQAYAAVLASALESLSNATADLENRVAQPMAEVENELTAAAVTLAEALLGRELTLATDPALDAVRRALALAPQNRPVTIRLHPAEAEAVSATIAAGGLENAAGRAVTIIGDPSIEPAGCVVDCDATRIDAQLTPALERVWEVLRA